MYYMFYMLYSISVIFYLYITFCVNIISQFILTSVEFHAYGNTLIYITWHIASMSFALLPES